MSNESGSEAVKLVIDLVCMLDTMLEHHLGLMAALIDPLFVRLFHEVELLGETVVVEKRAEMLVLW
jgi:hypothetical protein